MSGFSSLLISLIAVIVSVSALYSSRRQDRRNMFLKIHERMIDPDIHAGRRWLLERVNSESDAVVLRQENESAYFSINRSIAMLDVVALYVRKNYVAKELVAEEWGEVYRQCYVHARFYIAARHKELTFNSALWPHFVWFAGEMLNKTQLTDETAKPVLD